MNTRIQREKQKVGLLISFTPGLRAQNSAPVRLATESISARARTAGLAPRGGRLSSRPRIYF
eukprot:SAG11_NODE_3972_length_2127_cov_5.802761_2_plen_62_part_00